MFNKANLYIVLCIFFQSSVCYSFINKTFLRYNQTNRQATIAYASDHWNNINKGYKNYGNAFTVRNTTTGKDITYVDCKGRSITPPDDECSGDCANFVSQCLIEGGINVFELTQNVDRREMRGQVLYFDIFNFIKNKGK